VREAADERFPQERPLAVEMGSTAFAGSPDDAKYGTETLRQNATCGKRGKRFGRHIFRRGSHRALALWPCPC
jgi:hypothetical protein